MKPDEGGGQVFTVSRDFKADNADALTVHTGEKLVLVKAEGGDPSKWLMQSLDNPKRKGWVPIVVLTPKDDIPESVQQVIYKREAVISELVETEEEYCRDIMQVVDYYMKPLDGAGIPRHVCDNKDKVFGNYKDIAVFHNTVLLEGIKYYAKEPKQLGRAFLRMERDFDKHVTYCHDEPAAQDFLEQNESIRDYFDDLGSRISDDKNIGEHLKLPVQRINDYQLLLKELVKYSERLEEDTTDLNKALELMLGIPHKADDLKYITNIEGYHGDIHKLGRLLRHNWFKVKGKDGKERERYLFLFKARILICKVRKIAGDSRYVFGLKDIIRLPDVQVKDHKTEPRTFEVGQFTLTTHQDHVKEPWLEEIRQYSKNALTLAEHQADDLRLEAPSADYPLKGVELILATPGNSSDEEMDKSSRRTSLSQRVQELRSSSITESSYTMTSSSKTVVMEVSSQGTHIEESSHFETSSSGPTVIEKIETQRKASSAVEIEDMTSRCNLQSLFTKTIEGCTAEPGGSAAFECDIEAAGNLTWIKDNKPIDDRLHDRITQMSVGSHHRLEILNVAEADAGVYTAIANTSSGKVSTCTANLVVEKLTEEEKKARDEANAPLFVVRLRDTEIMQNTFLRFMVKVKGNPNPTVKFYKDDVEITYKNERLAVNNEKENIGYYEMVIPSVQTADVGVYKCVATNSFGSATSEGRVTVVDEKKVFEGIEPPKRKPSANGTAAKDDAQFQWIKDGKPFDPEERFKVLLQDDEDSLALVFTHVKPEDAGLYTCVASTTSGKISCSAELTVQGNVNLLAREPEAPAINAAHKEVDSNVGSSAMLETKIKGYPKPDIKWFRNDKELVMGDRYKLLYEDEETISLVVKTVTSSDDGVYKVVATNAAGSSEDTVTLNIKAPPSFKKKLNDVRVTAGAELKLQIEVQANPKPDVQWFKDGKQITESEHVKLIEESETYTLLIEKSTLFDVGSYSVICKNNISQCSEFCKVEIEGAPVFTRNLIKKVETEEGDSLTFLVKVHGNPMPIVKWYFKGQPVITDNRCKIGHDMDTHTLTINSINRKDAGEYTCELQNAHGSVKDHGVVMVKCSPEFSKGLGNLVAQEGDTNVGFSVDVSSFPKGKVRWFINTKEISTTSTEHVFKEEENSYTMVIKEVTRDSAGTYTCKVENSYGFSDSSAELTVLCKPKFKQELKNVTVNAGDKLTLEIEIQGTPAPEIKWFKDGNEITNDMHIKIKRDSQRIENYSLTVDLVKAEDSGEYEVRATNEMGSAISKSTVTVQTKSSSGFYDTTTSRTTKDDNSNTTLSREKYRETENTKNNTTLNPISENHIDETTFFKPAYSTDEPDADKNKQRRSSQKNSFAKRFNISVEDVFEEPVKIMSADEEEDDVTGGTEPLVSEPCTPMSPEKIKNRLEIEEVTDSSQRVIDIKIEVEEGHKGKNFERFESVAAEGSAVRTETITTRTMDSASGKGIEITTSTVERVELSERHIGTDEPPETKKALSRDKVNRNESTETKPDLSDLEKPDKAALDGESLKKKSESDLKKEQAHVENQSEQFATDKESKKDLPQQGSLDEDDPVEKLLKKSKEQRASLSQIIQRNQDTEESRLQAIPKITESQMKNSEIFETWEATFQVSATGEPHPEAIWTRNGEVLEASQKRKMTDDGQTYKLEILDCQVEDEGEYKVTLKNVLGEDSDKASLSVIPAKSFRLPQIQKPLVDQTIPKNETVNMTVVLTADPIPEVEWKHGDKDLSTDKDIILNAESKQIHHGLKECTYTMTIPVSKHFDTGAYSFTASNKSGTVTSNARLDIVLKPEFELFKDITIVPYEDATFVAVIRSNPRATLTWRKDGTKISDDDHYTIINDAVNEIYKLKISNVHPQDEGLYTLSAVNEIGEASADARLMVHTEQPSFTKTLEDIAVRDYAQLELKIRAEGVPKPDISWAKDGVDLVETEGMQLYTRCEGTVSSTLTIPHFSEEYCGRYKARAQSLSGHSDTQCVVKMVQLAPSFSKALERAINIEETDPVDLYCKVEASPRANIKWFKDGEELQPSENVNFSFKPDGTVKLRIESATPEDCGAYKLVAENANGMETAICAVSVTPSSKKPEIIKRPEDLEVTEGTPMILEAKIIGFPLPEVKWFKDGIPVRVSKAINFVNSPGGLIGLSIEHAGVEHAGEYTLTVSNKLGEASATAKVSINLKDRKPEFHGHLVPTTVIEGFPAKLCIKIAGTPLPQLSWSLNGTPLEIDGEHLRVVELPDGMFALMIENTGPLDAGTYAVTASNPAGSVTSSAKLEVAGQARKDMPEEKPAFAYELRDAHADEGSQLQFSIPFRGNPVPQVHWTRNGLPIKPDHRITLTNDGHKLTLQINPCEMSDIGEYVCRLCNQLGNAETLAKANVRKIFHAPVFSQKLMDMEQVIGLDGKLLCRVSGNPRPKISWFRNGKQIHEEQKYSIKREGDTCVLYIKECSPDDDGIFTCIAENRDGQDSCQATFKAVDRITSADKGEKPCFLKKIGDQEVINGITGRLTACVSGYPTPEVEWYRNGDRLYPSDRIKMDQESNGLLRLTVTHIDPAIDIGKYKVRIVNDHGEAECEASFIYDIMGLGQRRPVGEQYKDFEEFKLTGSPLPLADKPIISRMSDRRLTLSWKPSIPIGPREPVSYLVEMCEMPSGSWFIARSGLRSCTCEIRNLEPFRDYKFRVRVENKFGVSEPSPFSQTFRAKLLPDQPKFIPYLAPGIDFRPDTSPYFPKDFDIERPPHDGYSQAPRFLRQEHFTQYGVKGHNCNLFWFVYGYPKPKMSYFFNGEPIEMGGRYDSSYTRNGQATLFINRMLERDVGVYEAIAFNEHGEARQRVHLEIAEYPEFIKRPEEITILARQGGRIEARVVGVPYPDVKWFKDWQPLTHSARMKIQRYDPDHCVLAITDAITKDSGLYSITASNVAGAVSCSVMVHVEEKEEFPFHLYGLGHNIKLKTKNLSDFYDLGDELGRGTQGITYHAVERVSGRNYAAKVMKGKGELKTLMHNELDIMNVLRHHKLIKIHDGFETLDTIILVIELASGGELLDCLTKTPYTNENEIASYIRQLLVGLDYLHEQNIAHVGLTPGDILVSHSGGDGIKICDYGLARRIHPGQLRPEPFGMPEYVSPEIVKGEGVDLGTDMWSVGVITHLLLTGISLFKGANDMETLTKVREGFWEFNEEYWKGLSLDARDFITKLLVINVDQRMTVKEALRHPWLKLADYAPADPNSISTENLHNYYNSWKDWYSNASCRTWYRRRPLMGAFSHPSKMVYPPNYIATPTESPEREVQRETRPRQNLGDAIFSRQPIGYDVGGVSSESHYQSGPDTYLLQLRDVDFPVRLREYMKVAAHRHTIPKITDEPSHLDWQLPVIRERRRFTDVMDEEIDDERKLRINKYALGDSYTVRRLKHELGTRLDTHVEAEALIEATRQGQAPFMREKPQATAVQEGKTAELVCFAVGDPAPLIQWFKNDMMIGDSNRVKILDDEKGRSILKFDPAINSDTGIYKVVARNRIGQTVARARVVLAGVPDAPDSPEVTDISDTQALLRWKQPKHDGNDPVTCYMLQSKVVEGGEWKTVSDKIDHEFYLVQRLSPVTGYIFRLAAKNNIGWSDTGVTSATIRTKEEGTAKVQVSKTMKALQAISEAGHGFIDDSKPPLDYVLEDNPKPWLNHVPTEKYTLISEIYRGRFSVVVKAIDKSSDQVMVCKLFENSPVEEQKVTSEFEVLRRLKHERIANLIEAYMPPDVNYCAFVLEKLQGADILTYLSNRHEYNEQMVATTISQVLDALQYLHWRGLCHLDLQPDNIVMASVRSIQVKLIDFGCAQKVTKLGTPVKTHGALEFSAPEVICQEPAYPQSDIWSIGVLAYLLLSGVSPFHGENIGETRQNINFVRFRFEHLFKEITQEATRFLMQIFKRTPTKRPSAEECHEHRWLCPNEYMIKKRERAVFLGNRLKPFSELYHQQREQEASSLETLTCLVSSQGPLARSNSIAEELNTS